MRYVHQLTPSSRSWLNTSCLSGAASERSVDNRKWKSCRHELELEFKHRHAHMHASNGKLRRSPCDGGEVSRFNCFRHHRDFALSQTDSRDALVLALRRPAQVVGVRRFRRRGDLKRADVLHPPQVRLPVADDQVPAQPSNRPDM